MLAFDFHHPLYRCCRQGQKKTVQKRRKTTQQNVLKKIYDSLKSLIEYQQQADRLFLEAEMERERKEDEREAKRRKEDQEFFLKLAKVLKD